MKNKKQDPYNVQLADLANELGGHGDLVYEANSLNPKRKCLVSLRQD